MGITVDVHISKICRGVLSGKITGMWYETTDVLFFLMEYKRDIIRFDVCKVLILFGLEAPLILDIRTVDPQLLEL